MCSGIDILTIKSVKLYLYQQNLLNNIILDDLSVVECGGMTLQWNLSVRS